MIKNLIMLSVFLLVNPIQIGANDGLASELSHVAGGVVTAGAITVIVDNYYPEYTEDRGMIGFGISSIVFAIIEGINIIQDGNAKSQLLDIASHVLGSGIGAYVTDEYILSPVIKTVPSGSQSVGIQLSHSF